MISIEAQYFSLARYLSLSIGLWPYRQAIFAQLQYIFFFSILITAVIFHFTTFITLKCTPKLIIEVFSFTLIFIIYIIEYNALWFNSKTVKFVLEQLQCTCNGLKRGKEIAIIEEYGKISRRYMIALAIIVISGAITFILVQFWTSILDVVLPRNESRPRHLLFRMEYFMDQRKTFYLMSLHTNACICLGKIIGLIATIVLHGSLQCTCGLFSVACYRIERAMRIDLLQNVSPSNINLISEGLIQAVDIHRKAMKLSILVIARFNMMLTTIAMIAVLSLSLNLFRVFQVVSTGLDIEKLLLPLAFVIVIICYMFLINFMVQGVTDHNNQIFLTVYNVRWYRAPVQVQKHLILFLLQKGTKDFTLTVGGLITGSLQCFASLINASMSYFTLMYATQR